MLRREEGIEDLFLHFGRNPSAVVANSDLYAVAEVLRRGHKNRFIAIAIVLLFALGCRIEAVGDQVQESPCDLLRVHIVNALVEESLNLAYHGARAEKQDFNITLERSFDPAAGRADVFPQDITRALLNLISNGSYAATKRRADAGDGYEPTLVASTRSLGDRVEIRVRDNGTGIPPDVKEKIFNPFFTTKPAGEGTSLGLSISHDVIVKQHCGSIDVQTEPGAFSEFIIVLPRAGVSLTKSEETS